MKKNLLSVLLCTLLLFSVVVTFSACQTNTAEETINNEQTSSAYGDNENAGTTFPSDGQSNTEPITDDSTYEEIGNAVRETITSIEAVMSHGAGAVSFDEYNSELFRDYRSAVQAGNGYMCINLEKAREIAQEKVDVLQSRIQIEKDNKLSEIMENEKRSEILQSKIESSDYKDGETAETVTAQLETLTREYNLLSDECIGYDILLNELERSVGGYQNWIYSSSSVDYGNISHDAVQAIQWIADTYNPNSDIYLDFGSLRFCSAVEWIIPDTASSDLASVEKYMDNLRPYILLDESSRVIGLDYNYFMSEAIEAGLMVEESGGIYIADNVKMIEFSEKLGLSEGLIQAFFDELQSIGWAVDFTE